MAAKQTFRREVEHFICELAQKKDARSEPDYLLVREDGSPNHGRTPFSKRVMAQIRSPLTKGEDIEADPSADGARGAQVSSQRGLTIGAGRNELELSGPLRRGERRNASPDPGPRIRKSSAASI
jgi:hypothetical protein